MERADSLGCVGSGRVSLSRTVTDGVAARLAVGPGPATRELGGNSMAKESILVADDEPDVLDVALRTLAREGYHVVGVSNGAEAVEKAQQERFDLLVADVKMPGMTGLQAFRLIKQFSPDTIGLIVTGYGTLEMAIEAVGLGVNAFILKPFGPDELGAAVNRALEGRRLAEENARLRALLPLHELTTALVRTTDLRSLATQIVDLAVRETGATSGSLFLLGEDDSLYLAAAHGEASLAQSSFPVVGSEGLVGWVAACGEAMRIEGGLAPDGSRAYAAEEGLASVVCLPLNAKGETVGVIALQKDGGSPGFTEADNEMLSILAGGAAVAVENARLFSDLQAAYESLAELDHRKSEFIAVAAHELRAPLASVITYATLIEDGLDSSAREHLRVILDASTRLQLLLDDMLNLRNLDREVTVPRPQAVAVAGAVEHAIADLAHLAQTKEQVLQAHLPPDLPPVFADPEQLQVILLNLLSNAVKFTPSRGRITVEARAEGSEMVISVRDTGIGIPAAEQTRVFERFYQVADSLRREHAGLGLGLPITKGMVELHGGRIWIESEEGRGSTFSFTLPVWCASE